MEANVLVSGSEESVTEWMVCDQCEFPIFAAASICTERVDTLGEAVYSYELDVLEDECWCYSATNPNANRFDVVRCKTPLPGVRITGAATPEYSWFNGFAWQMAACQACGNHLGWAFSPFPADRAEVVFFGLIVTRMHQKPFTPTQMQRVEQERAEISQHAGAYARASAQLREVLNSLPVSAASQFYPLVMMMETDPSTRSMVFQVLEGAIAQQISHGIAPRLQPGRRRRRRGVDEDSKLSEEGKVDTSSSSQTTDTTSSTSTAQSQASVSSIEQIGTHNSGSVLMTATENPAVSAAWIDVTGNLFCHRDNCANMASQQCPVCSLLFCPACRYLDGCMTREPA